jgi:hypothetical protein
METKTKTLWNMTGLPLVLAMMMVGLSACSGVYAPGDSRVVGAVPMHCTPGHPFESLPDCAAPAGAKRVGTLFVRE